MFCSSRLIPSSNDDYYYATRVCRIDRHGKLLLFLLQFLCCPGWRGRANKSKNQTRENVGRSLVPFLSSVSVIYHGYHLAGAGDDISWLHWSEQFLFSCDRFMGALQFLIWGKTSGFLTRLRERTIMPSCSCRRRRCGCHCGCGRRPPGRRRRSAGSRGGRGCGTAGSAGRPRRASRT